MTPWSARNWDGEIRIADIALLPDFCNRGIGAALLRQLQAEAQASGKPLRMGVYPLMEWRDIQ